MVSESCRRSKWPDVSLKGVVIHVIFEAQSETGDVPPCAVQRRRARRPFAVRVLADAARRRASWWIGFRSWDRRYRGDLPWYRRTFSSPQPSALLWPPDRG